MIDSLINEFVDDEYILERSICLIEFFRVYSGLSDSDFVKYLEDYSIIDLVSNKVFIWGTLDCSIKYLIKVLGKGLSHEQQLEMWERFRKANPSHVYDDDDEEEL